MTLPEIPRQLRVASPTGERHLQIVRGTVADAERFHADQVLDHLNPRMREFIGRQEMMFIATADRRGACDSSLRAGPPGFVQVLDARRLAWPEYRGNGVMASVGNVVENPHIGLLFVDFFHDTVGLHVNARVQIVEDGDIRHAHPDLPVDPAPGRRPVHWLTAHVEEAYIHCSKHIPHLAKATAEATRSKVRRVDFFSVRANRVASSPAGDRGDDGAPRRWSIARLLAYRPAAARSRRG
jgi:predicted pyridoxine 5'-phosphate oxidase superfamily flavin-nucleotide-binding protein